MAACTNQKKDMLLLYDKADAKDWAECIQKEFTDKEPKVSVVSMVDLKSNIDNMPVLCREHAVVTILISPSMMEILSLNVKSLSPCLHKHKNVAGIRLYLEEVQDKLNQEILPQFIGSHLWHMFDIGATNTNDNLINTVSSILDLIQQTHKAMKQEISTGTTPKTKHHTQISAVCPDSIRQGGETVMVAFAKPLHSIFDRTVQVCFGTDDTEKLDTKTINESCITFVAPAHKPGKCLVYLFIDGKKWTKTLIHYSPTRTFAYTFPEFLCQLLCFESTDKNRLDHYLANVFKASCPQDGSLGYMLTPKNIAAEAGVRRSEDDLPTLLHFACKYDLNTLASSIIDMSGAYEALEILNKDNMSPLDIAEHNENTELVNYIEVFLEMQDYMTEVEDLYEKMSNGKSLQSYSTGRAGASGYIPMTTSQDDSVEDYTAGRCPLSDYEITDKTGNQLVQEVDEDEDIKEPEERPPPVPERKSSAHKSPMIKEPPVPARKPSTGARRVQPDPEAEPPNPNMMFAIPHNDPMAGHQPLSPGSMGSNSLDELYQYLDGYKQGELNLNDCEKLYTAWQDRHRDISSSSIKEKKRHMDNLKVIYEKTRGEAKKKKEGGFFSRLTRRRNDQPKPIEIQHNVRPNNYDRWECMQGRGGGSRDSLISNASTASTTSSSSRDSALEPIQDVDEEPFQDVTSECVERRPSLHREGSRNRNSWGNQYLQNQSQSRLPIPPPRRPNVNTLINASKTAPPVGPKTATLPRQAPPPKR